MVDGGLDLYRARAEVFQHVHYERVVFRQQAEQEMLGTNVLMVSAMRFLARLDQRAAHPGSEIVAGQKTSPSWDLMFVLRAGTARFGVGFGAQSGIHRTEAGSG